MYAKVVVLTYQSPDIQTYTYEIPKELETQIKVGQLVWVPFGKRNPAGIVSDTMPEIRNSPFDKKLAQGEQFEIRNLKKISNIILDQPLVLPYQIKLLNWMAFYYHAPIINCLEAILPEIPKRVTQSNSISHQPSAISHQTLILVPTINRLPETLAKFPKAKNYVIYHNELKTTEKFFAWLKILSGQVDFIFGSRSAIFVPCPKLEKIIIFDEHDNAYKEERSPHYDTLTIAEKLSKLIGCQIKIIDSSPKITTYFLHKAQVNFGGWQEWKGFPTARSLPTDHKKNMEKYLKTSTGGRETTDRTRSPKVQIVSMLEEKASGNRSPISDILSQYLQYIHSKGGKSLLFLNKKIESGHYYCKTCKSSDFAPNLPETCPNCGSPDIWFNTLNISTLAQTVKKLIPNATINILAEGVSKTTEYRIQNTEYRIDIATASIFYRLIPQKYELVAHIATDTTINISDFTFSEKLYSQIISLKGLATGVLILQTYNPDHPIIKYAATSNYFEFAKSQLTERKSLAYPPFAILIKLTLKGKDDQKLAEKAERLVHDLKALNYPLPTILGPYKPLSLKSLRYNIILKIPISDYSLATREKASKSVSSYLDKVPRSWQIIVEPNSIN